MRTSLLLKVSSALKKKERLRFETFLSSPFFNSSSKSDELIGLWKIINRKEKKANVDRLEKSNVYQELYPGARMYKGKLEKLMSQLLQLLHQFIVVERSTANSTAFQLELYQFYMERGLETEAAFRIKSHEKQQSTLKPTAQNLYDKFAIAQIVTQFNSLKNSRREDLNLPALLEQLDQYYLFTKLEYSLQMLTINQWISPIEFGDALKNLELHLKMIPAALNQDPVFQLYLQAYQLLKDFKIGDAGLFSQFLNDLEESKAACTQQQLKSFEALARNYCVHFYLQGKDEFEKLGYQLYRKHLQEGLLYHKDKMLVGTFHNLVLLGIRNNEISWVRSFIEAHKDKISGYDDDLMVYNLYLATLKFYEQSYDEALDLLTINFADHYLKLAARRLEIMIFFEQRSPIFPSKLEAYKIYVYRISDEGHLKKTKDRNRQFVDILKQIQHPKTMGNATRIDKLLKKIQATKYLAERPWLLEKLKALRKKK